MNYAARITAIAAALTVYTVFVWVVWPPALLAPAFLYVVLYLALRDGLSR